MVCLNQVEMCNLRFIKPIVIISLLTLLCHLLYQGESISVLFVIVQQLQQCCIGLVQDVNMDGLVPTLDCCCKAIGVMSTDRGTSVVPYTPPCKSAPPDSVSMTVQPLHVSRRKCVLASQTITSHTLLSECLRTTWRTCSLGCVTVLKRVAILQIQLCQPVVSSTDVIFLQVGCHFSPTGNSVAAPQVH